MATLRTLRLAVAIIAAAPCPARAYESQSTTSVATPASGYLAMLRAWLESQKWYPDATRQRGEEGHVGAALRCRPQRASPRLRHHVEFRLLGP